MFNINKFKKEIESIKKLRNSQAGLSAEKQAKIKSNILNAIAQQSLENENVSFWFKYKRKTLQYFSVIIFGLTVFGGTAFASSNALPGEIFYPIKRAAEKLQLNVAVSEEAKTNLQAKFAQKRLKELGEIREQKKPELREIQSILPTTTPAVGITSTTPIVEKPKVRIGAVKFKESKVEKEAKLEAQAEVKEALVNLRKLQKKLTEQGQETKAKALGTNILELKTKALEKDIKEDEEDKIDLYENIKLRDGENKPKSRVEINLFKKY